MKSIQRSSPYVSNRPCNLYLFCNHTSNFRLVTRQQYLLQSGTGRQSRLQSQHDCNFSRQISRAIQLGQPFASTEANRWGVVHDLLNCLGGVGPITFRSDCLRAVFDMHRRKVNFSATTPHRTRGWVVMGPEKSWDREFCCHSSDIWK